MSVYVDDPISERDGPTLEGDTSAVPDLRARIRAGGEGVRDMHVEAFTDWSKSTECEFRVSGALPGRSFEASSSYTPADGSPGVETGWSSQKVRPDGTTTFSEGGAALVGAASRPGVLTIWLRNPPSEQDGPPVRADGVPMVVTVSVP